ncbi:uncharacterized protein LOC122853685 [Aphidius gifuensis]|uniref:uncharacterized protein LOC122853685 n=1 Tax=Aphidius gifuensis TaxID=684658 RepID=UPI001CDC27FC|nr:uncharacterized protein LOC122853685 [Aphidius gifuensis]
MFREGQYLEVIKASDDCLATAIVTVKERIIEIEKKKVSTNKWLTLQDWSSLYAIITKALLKSIKICRDDDNKIKSLERKKSTKTLDVIYKFEAGDESSLPTIKVRVCQAKKSLNKQNVKKEKKNNKSSELQVEKLIEESSNHDKYIPPELTNEKNNNLKYIPSRKSLLNTKFPNDEYTPSLEKKLPVNDVSYVPKIVKNLNKKINNKSTNDEYNPTTTTTAAAQLQEEKDSVSYTPHAISTLKAKNKKSSIYKTTTTDEYIPNVILSNDEYVPSGGQSPNDGPSYVPNSISDLSNSRDEYIPTIDVNRLNKKTNYSQDKNKKIKKNQVSESLTGLSNDEYTPEAVCELSNDGAEYVPDLSSNLMEKKINESKIDEVNDEYIPKSLNGTTTTAIDSVEYVPDFLLNKKTKNSINQSVIDKAEQPDEYIPTSEIKWSKNKYSSSLTSKKRKKNNFESVIDTTNDEYIPTSKPCKLTTDLTTLKYIPSLKNSNSSIIVEEYEPNFATNKIDFNLSYVPSSTKIQNDEYIPLKKKIRKAHEPKDPTKRKNI